MNWNDEIWNFNKGHSMCKKNSEIDAVILLCLQFQ